MDSRPVYAEEHLLNYLETITKEKSSAIGLLIGYSTNTKHNVLHMARTRDEEVITFTSIVSINASLVHEHMGCVDGSLSDGLSVLGIFICFQGDILSKMNSSCFTKFFDLETKNSQNINTLFPFPDRTKLVFHYDPVNKRYACKYFDINEPKQPLQPIKWKFESNSRRWCEITTKNVIKVETICGLPESQSKLLDSLPKWYDLLEKSEILVGNKHLKGKSSLQSLMKTAKMKRTLNGHELLCLDASVFLSLSQAPPKKTENKKYFRIISHECVLVSRVHIDQDIDMATAEKIIKQAIYKNVKRKITAVPVEPYQNLVSESTVLVFIPHIPCSLYISNANFELDDLTYMFTNFLDIDVTQKDIYQLLPVLETPEKINSTHSDDLLRSTLPTRFLIAAISFAVLLIGIAVALQMQSSSGRKAN